MARMAKLGKAGWVVTGRDRQASLKSEAYLAPCETLETYASFRESEAGC